MKFAIVRYVIGLVCLVAIRTSTNAQSLETGMKHYYYGRSESAEKSFHDQLSPQPGNGSAWLWLVKSYIRQGEIKNAADSLALAPATVYDDPYYKIARGALLLAGKENDSASLFFNEAIDDTKGKNATVLGEVAEAYLITDNPNAQAALEVIDRALKRDKRNAGLYVLQGDAYRILHDATNAFQSYKRAIEENKGLAEAYYKLGDIFVGQKNDDVYLEYFNQAIAADDNYGPAHYALYRHYYTRNAATARHHFTKYTSLSDRTIDHEYSNTDLLYLTGEYQNAINNAIQLIQREGDKVQPRLYKLVAYSYQSMKDSVSAVSYMKEYFKKEVDSNFLVKDFETMGGLFARQGGNLDSAMIYYERALPIATDSSTLYEIYDKLADLAKAKGDYLAEAQWLGKYYTGNESATNVNLFNWGLALFRSKEFKAADSVFGLYTVKYPDQGFGFYWRARSNAALDDEMKEGLAVPHYDTLITMLSKDSTGSVIPPTSLSATDKKWLIEAYGYLAAYETNTEGDYPQAIAYFEQLLTVDPENANAKKYIAILKDNIAKGKAGAGNKDQQKEEEIKN